MGDRAKESAQVRKYRRKLRKQLDAEHAMMDEAAIAKVKDTIQQWISRHQGQRIDLRDKTISLFDENRHPAKAESKFVQGLFETLRQQASLDKERFSEGKDNKAKS